MMFNSEDKKEWFSSNFQSISANDTKRNSTILLANSSKSSSAVCGCVSANLKNDFHPLEFLLAGCTYKKAPIP